MSRIRVDAALPRPGRRVARHVALLLLWLLIAAGCSNQMADQPRYEVYEPSTLFADGQSSRHLVPGTVPRGQPGLDELLYTGRLTGGEVTGEQSGAVPAPGGQSGAALTGQDEGTGGEQGGGQIGGQTQGEGGPPEYADVFPFPITEEMMRRGQVRYNAFCTPCHSRLGDGDGMVVRRGFPPPPSLHEERLREAPVGYLYDVITNGIGVMPPYDGQIFVQDRWAIVAYIRALQRSQSASLDDVPETERDQLENGGQ